MVLKEGGPCIRICPAKGARPEGECGKVQSHAWYAGPTCKSCYERLSRGSGGKRRRDDAPDEEADDISGGDNLLEVLKISAARCVQPPRPLPPSPAPTASSLR